MSAPQPARWAWIGKFVCCPSAIIPAIPAAIKLTITQVPPCLYTKSCRLRISSISPVRLKATMTLCPILSAALLTASMTSMTRSSKGQDRPFACNSSSLMKSIPPAQSWETNMPVSLAESPTLGLMIVPIKGRSYIPINLRVPSHPNFGPA